MACFRPLDAYQLDSGEIVFSERGKIKRALTLPCGRCIGCRLSRQQAWALRCLHEAQLHDHNSFVTLTYDEHNCPPSLKYGDFQRFMYRLRKKLGPTRFFACGEYGELNRRPHFHAILFGRTFSDGTPCGANISSSPTLSALWPHGFSSFGNVTYQSAAYVAGYTLKKRTGPNASDHYLTCDWRTGELVEQTPEMGRMSLRPGIGYAWFQKYWREVYSVRDGCVLPGGKTVPAPSYYDKLLLNIDSDLAESKALDRYTRSLSFASDTTPARLLTREICAKARITQRTL